MSDKNMPMVEVTDRRSVLRAFGVIGTTAIAGCSALQNTDNEDTEPANNETPTETSSTDSPQQDGDDETDTQSDAGDINLEEAVTGDIKHATSINDTLTYVTAGGQQRVVHGGEEGSSFKEILDQSLHGVDGGVAYRARATEDGTEYGSIMSAGEELARYVSDEDITTSERTGERGRLWDVLEGRPVFSTWSGGWDDNEPATIRHGNDEITPDYDGVNHVTVIDGDIGYIGLKDDGDPPPRWIPQAVVVGDEVIDDPQEGFVLDRLRSVGGEPAYVKDTGDGPFVQHGDTAVGQSFTSPGNGDIDWFGDLDGSLGVLIKKDQEDILLYEGEEIARHETIYTNGITATSDGIVYNFDDGGDEFGLMVGGDAIDQYVANTAVTSIDGTLAYAKDATDGSGQIVVYGDQQTESYSGIENVFELDGQLAFHAVRDSGEDVVFTEA